MSSLSSDEKSQDIIEATYQKKSQLEHILLRPDSYVGSIKNDEKMLWVYDSEKEAMIERKISYNPALYKIFDEILVNASDNKIRDPKMTCIKITIDGNKNMVRIWNNGKGIPVVIHKTENVYIPTLIFGHLLTSSNFNDDQKKVVGGRNGYGAKLCNIFSTEFSLETSSREYRKTFKQTWSCNMSSATDPVIGNATKEDFTSVTFYPDLKRFGMTKLDKDIIDLFSRRAYDIAACTNGVTVFLNGQQLPIKGFKDYVDLYLKNMVDSNNEPLKVVYEKYGDRWEVAMTTSLNDQFTQVSFVNSIATTKGGTHVNYLTDQAAVKLLEIAKKKIKDDKQAVKLKPAQVKMNLWIFVKSLIDNPSFDSQTKENMTLQSKDFGSTCILSDKFINQAAKTGIVEKITMWANFKNLALLDKNCSKNKQCRLKGIAKLDDANYAGTKKSIDCTLILTEGDSAKTLAVSGLSVIGRDNYGVFPLRGKLLNVREATSKQLMDNIEINNLIKILGLQYKQKYETSDSMKSLRYGKVMIMTDQDQDGSHIKGLIINFIHNTWPNLLKNNFIEQFITPIIKATKDSDVKSFFSIPEFNEWMNVFPDSKTYHVKYYKGLGTSTGKEAKEYFSDMNRHLIKFKYGGIEDDNSIILAFAKNKADDRKEWLTGWMEECKRRKVLGLEEEYLYEKNTKQVTFENFVKKELVLFSNTDNERSIPSVVDGFKPGQRKVMYACLKRNLTKELRVVQLAGSVAELSSYHHGEQSLYGTITNLAQDYVGSNNINVLVPSGQFGTRLNGGKDSASSRYISTLLSKITKLIFHPDDTAILKYLYDDNQRVEPEWYVPIIPMVLVNGADGIGTGWSTKIPNYNPKDIILNIRNLIQGRPLVKIHPWYRGFKGTIKEIEENCYIVSGEICELGNNTLEIIELPVKTWTHGYKETVMEVLLNGSDKVKAAITDYKEHHTDTTVRFVVEMTSQKYAEAQSTGFHKFFKLQSSLKCSNMVLFDNLGVIRKYKNVGEIFIDFHKVRLDMYAKRKNHLVGMLAAVASKLENQARFINEKNEGKIVVEKIHIKTLHENLVKRNYSSDPVAAWKLTVQSIDDEKDGKGDEDGDEDEPRDLTKHDFDYLTNMKIISLTAEKVISILAQRDAKLAELAALKKISPEELWLRDLDVFEKAYLIQETEADENQVQKSTSVVQPTKKKGKVIKISAETAPSKFGKRIEPVIDVELLKKLSVEVEKKKKATCEKKQQNLMEKHFAPQEDRGTNISNRDDDDDEPQSLAQRLAAQGHTGIDEISDQSKKKASKEKISKDKKSPVTKKRISIPLKRKKKTPWDSDSDAEEGQNDDACSLDIPRDTVLKRNAAKNVKYNIPEDSPQSYVESGSESEKKDTEKKDTEKKDTEKKDTEKKDIPKASSSSTETKTTLKSSKLTSKNIANPIIKKDKVVKKPNVTAIKATVPKVGPKPKATQKRKLMTSSDGAEEIFKPDDLDDSDIVSKKPRREVKKPVNVFDSDSENEEASPPVSSDSDFDIASEMKKSKGGRKKIIE